MPFIPGQRFAGRTVLGTLGHGGSGTVYRAVDDAGLVQALKVVDPSVGRDDAGRARFEREVAIAESLHHPNIVTVLDHGCAQDPALPGMEISGTEISGTEISGTEISGSERAGPVLWCALEYLAGGTAARLAPAGRGEPDVGAVVDVLLQAALGLDHAHAHDVVHGDVKPSNLLLSSDPTARHDGGPTPGRTVVTDFGLARLLDEARPLPRHGRILGSVPYAAPEVLQAGRVGPATDVYSLACTAVELLTGLPPYPRATAFAIAHAHVSAHPPRVSRRRRWVPAAVDAVVARGLAKDPDRRPGSCLELAHALARALGRTPLNMETLNTEIPDKETQS